MLEEYGIAWDERASVEVDHVVPLSLGGSNDIRNLFAQPIAEAHEKDHVEDRAHALVCSGRMRLEDAQAAFESDWRKLRPIQ